MHDAGDCNAVDPRITLQQWAWAENKKFSNCSNSVIVNQLIHDENENQ